MDWPEAGLNAALQLLKPLNSSMISVIDVGAHRGETLSSLAQMWPDVFTYVGLEPNPDSFADFEAVAGTLRADARQIMCLPYAAGPQDGATRFRMTKASAVSGILPAVNGLLERVPSGDHELIREIDVEIVTIGSLIKRFAFAPLDLLKIDTEGYDLEVLHGAQALLASQAIDVVLTEAFFVPYRVGQAYFWDIASFMRDVGYHFVNLYDTRDTSQGRLYTGNALWVSARVAQANNFL